jgi:hypothetical protein
VLGLSADFLWRKLGEHLGEEKVQQIRDHLDTLGGAWSFIRDVQERGIAAIWEYVQSRLSTLWSTILEIAMKWIVETLVVQGTIKLLGFLDPTFIMTIVNGCIAFYQGVMSTIEYIREILQIIDDYVSTIAAIARGELTPAAQKVEQGFAEALPVAIGFLAAQLGIGNIPGKIAEIILGIRQVVEAAIDWLIDQALKLGGAILDALGGDARTKPETAEGKQARLDQGLTVAQSAVNQLPGTRIAAIAARPVLAAIRIRFGLTSLELVPRGERWVVHGTVNPEGEKETNKQPETPVAPADASTGDREESEEVGLIDDDVTSPEERAKVLADVRRVVQNEDVIKTVLDVMRAGQMKKANRVEILRKLISLGQKDGYRLDVREGREEGALRGSPLKLNMDYYGIFREQTIKVGRVRPGGIRPIGLAWVQPKSVDTGEEPVPALALDFLVDPKIEQAGVKGVGSRMFTLAAEHYKTQYQAVAGEWYTMSFYAHRGTGRPPMSLNLKDYLAARKAGDSPQVAVTKTWTYRRVKQLYGGVELDVQVEERPNLDFDNPPVDAMIVECLMKPR